MRSLSGNQRQIVPSCLMAPGDVLGEKCTSISGFFLHSLSFSEMSAQGNLAVEIEIRPKVRPRNVFFFFCGWVGLLLICKLAP